ncbi:MAG: RNA polymerase sigma factor [Chloroflexi bacterium]|nr:RNA polymerase sigma factor [Chloroflexota bacterium]
MTSSERSDEEVARLAARGDRSAFDELVARYERPLFNFAYRMLSDYDEASDATQETLVQLFRSLPEAKLDLPFKPWVYRIHRNKCLDILRRKRTVRFSDLRRDDEDESAVDRIADARPLPEEVYERKDIQEQLHSAIAELPERYREVVSLRVSGELSFEEIAATLKIPENTAKIHFFRAKDRLRKLLAEGLGLASGGSRA